MSMRGGSFGGYSGGRGSFGGYRKGPARERSSFKHLGHLKRLFPYLIQYRWVLAFSLLGLLATRALMAVQPLLMKTAIDSLAYAEFEPNYIYPALGILAIVILQSGIYIATRWALRRISIAHHLRPAHAVVQPRSVPGTDVLQPLRDRGPHVPGGQRRSHGAHGRVVRVGDDRADVDDVADGAWASCSTLAPALSGWALIPLPFVGIVGWVMARGMYPYYRERQEAMAEVTSFAQENLNGIRTIQAMAQEGHEISRFRRSSTVYAQKCYRATR